MLCSLCFVSFFFYFLIYFYSASVANKLHIMLTDCTADQFHCDSGQCATVRSMCDGISYCVDGSDQANCSEYQQVVVCCQLKVEQK